MHVFLILALAALALTIYARARDLDPRPLLDVHPPGEPIYTDPGLDAAIAEEQLDAAAARSLRYARLAGHHLDPNL